MFEIAELGHKIERDQYDREEPKVQAELLRTIVEAIERRACEILGR